MLSPRRTKYRKQMRGVMKGKETRGMYLSFGDYGLVSLEKGWVSGKQIEAARRSITHYTQRGGRIWIRVFPDKPITKKPPEVRMGGGKGDIHEYVAPVKSGRILFEMSGVTHEIAREALRLAAHKLPVQTRFIARGE